MIKNPENAGRINHMNKDFTLEKHSFFPYIAWGVVCCFAFFTYTLTMELNETSDEIMKQKSRTLSALDTEIFETQ